MEKIKCIIVDDEELAREGLRFMLAEDRRFELVATCADGLTAIEQIEQLRPDLVFLDVQMPGVHGMEVIASLSKPRPYIIFTTAFEQYAIKAFEVNAIDYLLKPFSDERFYQSLEKAQQALQKDRKQEGVEQLLSQPVAGKSAPTDLVEHPQEGRLIVKSDGKVFQLAISRVYFIEAYDYYIKIHTEDRFFLVRETMKKMMDSLDDSVFVRVHKSFIVNVNQVKQVARGEEGYTALMTNDAEVKISRTYRKAFMERLRN